MGRFFLIMLVKASQSIARDGTEGILTGKGCKQVRAKQKTAGCRGADGGKELRCVWGGGGQVVVIFAVVGFQWSRTKQTQSTDKQVTNKTAGKTYLPTYLYWGNGGKRAEK